VTFSSQPIRGLDLPDVSQIGVILVDMDRAVEYYQKTIGLGPFIHAGRVFSFLEYRGERVESKWLMAFASLGHLELELIQTVSGPTIFDEFLRRGGEGLHHLGFDVKDLEASLERCRAIHIDVLMQGRFEGGGFAYLDTEKIGGVVFELIQRPARRA